MTLHPRGTEPPMSHSADPARRLEEAQRTARACSHSKRLERPIAAALDAIVDFGEAVVDRSIQLEAGLAEVTKRIAALEMLEATRVRQNP